MVVLLSIFISGSSSNSHEFQFIIDEINTNSIDTISAISAKLDALILRQNIRSGWSFLVVPTIITLSIFAILFFINFAVSNVRPSGILLSSEAIKIQNSKNEKRKRGTMLAIAGILVSIGCTIGNYPPLNP